MMTTVPVPLSEIELEKIDSLVRIGRYKNRSQALKALLKVGIAHTTIHFEWEHLEEEQESQQLLENMLKAKKPLLTILSDKSAHEIISEDRSR
jgi:Arc/MetJ-type ribon-helix-helix transcriptional regulator